MSTRAADLRAIAEVARPAIRAALDAAEELSTLRQAATDKGIDWSQLKSLLKAQEQDARDGDGEGKRVRKIVDKADFASAYADMLGLRQDERKTETRSSSPETVAGGEAVTQRTVNAPSAGSNPARSAIIPAPSDAELEIPAILDRRPGRGAARPSP